MTKLKSTIATGLNADLFNAIANQTTEGITVADMEGNYLYVNQAFCKMSGYTEEELLSKTVFDMKAENQNHQSFYDSKEKYEGVALRVNLQRKDGTEYLTEIIGDVIEVDGKQQVLGTIRDISEHFKAEMKIRELNKDLESKVDLRTLELEKTIQNLNDEIKLRKVVEDELNDSLRIKKLLLNEVTHRVKNNLQVISSILNLQKNSIESEESRLICEETSNRIQSMALIHETLYKSHEFSLVNFEDYMESLILYLSNVFEVTSDWFDVKISNTILSIDAATCCGMIASELITNSLKYAFTENITNPCITLELTSLDDNKYRFVISDNGKGLNEDLNIQKAETLGLQLVSSLVDQIEGTCSIERKNGTSVSIEFRDVPEKK